MKDKPILIEGIPYQSLFNRWNKAEKAATILVWLAGLFSILIAVVGQLLNEFTYGRIIIDILNIANCGLIISGIVCTWLANIHFAPTAEFERVGGNIDNAYETRILEKPLTYEYYTNGGVQRGAKRMAANCFESCFFTENISKEMTLKIVIKNIIFFFLFIVLAIISFNAESVSALFQFLLSSVLLEELIRHLYFRHTIHELFERFKSLYDIGIEDDLKFQAQVTYILLKYEKILAYYNQSLDSGVYKKLNPKLSDEWEEMKARYNIIAH